MEENKDMELEEMRQQLGILQKKLDEQDIVNERLIKSSMKGKMSWIKKYVLGETIAIPIIAIMLAGMYITFNIPFASYVYMIILCIADVYMDYRVNVSAMNSNDYENINLLETAKKLIRMKEIRSKQTFIGIILTLVWIIWLTIDMYNAAPISDNPFYKGALTGGMIGAAIGGVIGLVVAYIIYRKMQKTNDEVLEQIKDLTEK